MFGKTVVIKTFLNSQFTYVLRVLKLPDYVINEINTLFFRFFWRRSNCNKKAFERVKRRIVVSDYSLGGINMVDIRFIQMSFQLEWLMKLSKANQNDKWSFIPLNYFSIFGTNMAFLSNCISEKRFRGLELLPESFWKESLKVWLCTNKIGNGHNLKNQCLWNNENIQFQNNVLFFPNWGLANLSCVSQLFDNGVFLSYDSIARIVGRSAQLFFEYQIVRNAVNSFINNSTIPLENEIYPILFNDKKLISAKMFYSYLIESNVCTPTSERFWLNKFSVALNKRFWSIAIETTKESRLRELHWKILSNIYPTNILLNKMGIADSNKCSFCSSEIDFYEHFFFHCEKIKRVWDSVETRFYIKFGTNIHISDVEALLGIEIAPHLTKMQLRYLNHLILIAKMCISKFKYGTQLEILYIFEKECLSRNA